MATPSPRAPVLRPRFQVSFQGKVVLGPGKADLLEQIQATGSLAEAAVHMDMSYMRAWTLVKTMNECFPKPLVTTARGGKSQGGSQLTDMGCRVLALYRQLEQEANQATRTTWTTLRRVLAP